MMKKRILYSVAKETKLMQEKWGDQLIEYYMASYDVQVQRTRMLHVQ